MNRQQITGYDIGSKTRIKEIEIMISIRTNPATSAQFAELLNGWNRETAYLSIGNFNNKYFDEIVEMKEDAVPYIYEELKKGPTLLVHALDRIYPDKVQCEGYVPLTTICNVWLNILSKIVEH